MSLNTSHLGIVRGTPADQRAANTSTPKDDDQAAVLRALERRSRQICCRETVLRIRSRAGLFQRSPGLGALSPSFGCERAHTETRAPAQDDVEEPRLERPTRLLCQAMRALARRRSTRPSQ